jgi:hypothetical protein
MRGEREEEQRQRFACLSSGPLSVSSSGGAKATNGHQISVEEPESVDAAVTGNFN